MKFPSGTFRHPQFYNYVMEEKKVAKGKESIRDSIRGITQVLDAVEERPKSFNSILEVQNQLNEIQEEIDFQLLHWECEVNATRNTDFWSRFKARRKVRKLKAYRDELDYLFMRYENLVELRSK